MSGIRSPFVLRMKAETLLNRGFSIPQIAKLLNVASTKTIKRALKRGPGKPRNRKVLDDGPAPKVKRRQRES